MMKLEQHSILLVLPLMFLVGCKGSLANTPTAIPLVGEPTNFPTATETLVPTSTITPTSVPTQTLVPTEDPNRNMIQMLNNANPLRSCPNKSCALLATIKKGEIFEVLQFTENGWYNIQYGDIVGWVNSASTQPIGTVTAMEVLVFGPTPTQTPLPTPATLQQAVEYLDTPEKISDFLINEVQFVFHDGCISFSPDVFFKKQRGDCKDYATFASYVLDQNGYEAEIVTFTWYDQSGNRNGHVVVIYTEKDGTQYYMSNGEIVSQVTSVDNLLVLEKARINAGSIGTHYVLPAGTRNVCTP